MDPANKVCLVCSAPNNSLHFGIEACRACSSFFRRAKRSGLLHPCRTGLFGCKVTRNDKFPCKRCRYEKCVEMGMVYEGPLREAKKSSEESSEESQPYTSTSIDSYSPAAAMLARIGDAYEISLANRMEKELAFLRQCEHAALVPHPTQELYASRAELMEHTVRFTVEETWCFFHKLHPSLGELPYNQLMELFRSYLPKFTITDAHVHTWKTWGTFHEYYMTSVAQCLDLHFPDTWLLPDEGGLTRNERLESSMQYMRDSMETVVPAFEKAQITDREVHALLVLLLGDIDMKSDATERLLDSIRDEVLRDLQRYYREEMGLSDISARQGNLMDVCHAVRECASHFKSFFRMQVTMFDIYAAETQLKELLL